MGGRGQYIVIDGVDGCGKSTQAGRLVARLEAAGRSVRHVREPGSTPAGEAVRALLLGPDDLSAAAEALLVCAARRELLDRVVEPALAAGEDVVCERSHPSTYAYQGVAGGLGPERVTELLAAWVGSPAPDLVLVLDLAPELAARRRGPATDRIEARDAAYRARVAEGFRRWAAGRSEARLVDGSRRVEEVEAAIWKEVERAGARAAG